MRPVLGFKTIDLYPFSRLIFKRCFSNVDLCGKSFSRYNAVMMTIMK